MTALEQSDRSTHRPYKGDASYLGVTPDGTRSRGAVWTYETPHNAVAWIEGHLAFYQDLVAATEGSIE